MQRIRLIRKLAPMLNGIDLSSMKIGEAVWVPEAVAAMLIREGWAEVVNAIDTMPPANDRREEGE